MHTRAHCLHTHSVNSKGHLLHLQVLASAVAARQLVQAEDFFLVFVFHKGENGGEGKCKGGGILASTVSFELLLNIILLIHGCSDKKSNKENPGLGRTANPISSRAA